jgi:RHS repeat-associated protein
MSKKTYYAFQAGIYNLKIFVNSMRFLSFLPAGNKAQFRELNRKAFMKMILGNGLFWTVPMGPVHSLLKLILILLLPWFSTHGKTESYLYDESGNRIKKTSGNEAVFYINSIYEEKQNVTNHAVRKVLKHYFGTGQRMATYDAGQLNYVYGDHLGSTRSIADEMGYLQSMQDYLPFGSQLSDSPSTHQFNDKEMDQTGLANFGARYYDVIQGRLFSADSILPDPYESQQLNRFAYVANNPVKWIDPTGHYLVDFGLLSDRNSREFMDIEKNLPDLDDPVELGFSFLAAFSPLGVGGTGLSGVLGTSTAIGKIHLPSRALADKEFRDAVHWATNPKSFQNAMNGKGYKKGAIIRAVMAKKRLLNGEIQLGDKDGVRSFDPFTPVELADTAKKQNRDLAQLYDVDADRYIIGDRERTIVIAGSVIEGKSFIYMSATNIKNVSPTLRIADAGRLRRPGRTPSRWFPASSPRNRGPCPRPSSAP